MFQQFRLREIEQEILAVQKIEIYGVLCSKREICLQYLNCRTVQQILFYNPIHLFGIFIAYH